MARTRTAKKETMEEIRAKAIEGREYLVSDMQWIPIPVTVAGTEYYALAIRKSDEEYYRLSYNSLMDIYRRVRQRYPDTFKITIEPFPSCITPGYAVAACRLSIVQYNENQPKTCIDYDVQVGEVKVTALTATADKENPYKTAVRRARAKCIYADLLGLPSRFFKENGEPVVFFSEKDNEIADDKADSQETDATVETAKESAEVITEEKPNSVSLLSEKEDAEFKALCATEVSYPTKNGTVTKRIDQLSTDNLEVFSTEKGRKYVSEEDYNAVVHYKELLFKSKGIAA